MFEKELLDLYKKPITELLCPAKCQGILFLIYSDNTVKCKLCNRISSIHELLEV